MPRPSCTRRTQIRREETAKLGMRAQLSNLIHAHTTWFHPSGELLSRPFSLARMNANPQAEEIANSDMQPLGAGKCRKTRKIFISPSEGFGVTATSALRFCFRSSRVTQVDESK